MINYQELKKIGLSDKEAKIYLTSLSRGPETAPNLAKISNIVRPTAYVIIDSLIKKGLMSSYDQDKKTLQRNDIEEKEREIEKLIPELKEIANIKGEKPKVRVFEGKEGLKAVIESILNSKTKEIYSFIPLDRMFELFPEKEHSELMTKRRISKKIESKILYTNKKGPVGDESDPKKLRDAVYIPENQFPFRCGIDIYDKNIAMYTYKGKIIGVIIENEDMAETMRSIFKMAWQKYKK
ncbi:MAG: hypothetical protein NTX82_06640 [Candidatus Parcubacteria bacterium]|nr:hypothetical protein [Candidatus Parcubacteria bacterium]